MEKRGLCEREGETERELPLLLPSHKRRDKDSRVIGVDSVLIKVSSSCSALELFLKSIDLLTLSRLSDLHNYSAHST